VRFGLDSIVHEDIHTEDLTKVTRLAKHEMHRIKIDKQAVQQT